jgi:hypothetical protein
MKLTNSLCMVTAFLSTRLFSDDGWVSGIGLVFLVLGDVFFEMYSPRFLIPAGVEETNHATLDGLDERD